MLYGFWVAASRKWDARAGLRALASLPDYRHPINPTGLSLVWKDGTRLDDMAGCTVFLESEQSKNGAGEMVPLYAARVQDLGACRKLLALTARVANFWR